MLYNFASKFYHFSNLSKNCWCQHIFALIWIFFIVACRGGLILICVRFLLSHKPMPRNCNFNFCWHQQKRKCWRKQDSLLYMYFLDVVQKRIYMARFLPKDKLVSSFLMDLWGFLEMMTSRDKKDDVIKINDAIDYFFMYSKIEFIVTHVCRRTNLYHHFWRS